MIEPRPEVTMIKLPFIKTKERQRRHSQTGPTLNL